MGLLSNLSLFSGAGGLDLGAKIVGGFRTVCYVEHDPYAQGVLMSRIRDGGLDDAPIWDDVTTFDGRPWRGLVDVVSGGFPCQDLSVAGKREGIKQGNRSGLWFEFARIIREVGPRFVLVENVPGLLIGGLGIVLGDLAEMGFDAEWEVLSAAAVGAPHLRERVWIVGHAFGGRCDWESWWRTTPQLENGHMEMEARPILRSRELADSECLRLIQQERSKQEERGWPGKRGKAISDAHGVGRREGNKDAGESGAGEGQAQTCPGLADGGRWGVEPNVGGTPDGMAKKLDGDR